MNEDISFVATVYHGFGHRFCEDMIDVKKYEGTSWSYVARETSNNWSIILNLFVRSVHPILEHPLGGVPHTDEANVIG